MQPHIYKVTLNLRKTGDKILSLATRSISGVVVRSGGKFTTAEGIRQVVGDHQSMVADYDYTLDMLQTEERAAQKTAREAK